MTPRYERALRIEDGDFDNALAEWAHTGDDATCADRIAASLPREVLAALVCSVTDMPESEVLARLNGRDMGRPERDE